MSVVNTTTISTTTAPAITIPGSTTASDTPTQTPPEFVTQTPPPTVSGSTTPSSTDETVVDTNPQSTTSPSGLGSGVNVDGSITILNLPVSVTNTSSFGSINASGCVTLAGNLTITVSAADVNNGTISGPLRLISSSSNCIQGNFSHISAIPKTDDKCITLSAQPIYTENSLSVLITSKDRCKNDSFPRWAGGVIAGSVVLLAAVVVGAMYFAKTRGYLNVCFKEESD